MLWLTEVNVCNCRQLQQAKGTDRLGPKGKWVGRIPLTVSDTGKTPTGRQNGPKAAVVKCAERGNPMPLPHGQANRKAS
jgi:hypothetical protein